MLAIILNLIVSGDLFKLVGMNENQNKLYCIRHSLAHIMAQAVLEYYPDAKTAIGPPIDNGFYYDFELPKTFSEDDLEKIEEKMRSIIGGKFDFIYSEVSPEDVRSKFADQPYKIEIMEDLVAKNIDENGNKVDNTILSLYQQDTFVDLCRGPHLSNTSEINPKAFKLIRTAGAYWRGDEDRTMLTRIYGVAFETEKELEEHLQRLEEAKARDHRVLGKQLDFFSFSDMVGPGLALWHPKGALIRHIAENFSKEAHLINGYEAVVTPHIGRSILWETSGHLDFYKDGMYSAIDIEGDQYYLKPMNCPFHVQIYKSKIRSYRELPKRFAEFGTVYRYEKSGAVSGLTRVRGFTQDDAHIFCTPDQAQEEISRALRFCLYVLRTFGLTDFKAYISTKPPKKCVGSDVDWTYATNTLIETVQSEGIAYDFDHGGGAFYGPKIDLKLLDSIGREWQLSTVQFDFNLPVKFGLEYIGPDGNPHTPYMVHRALFGSVERFFAMLIENYKGEFPLWLAPVQATLIPISEAQIEFCNTLAKQLRAAKFRVEVDASSERMQSKIRLSETSKVPLALVVGKKEVELGKMSVRQRLVGDLGVLSVEELIGKFKAELDNSLPQEII